MESVFVLKNYKNFKNCTTLFWWLTLVGQSSHETPIASLLRSSCDSLASQAPNREKNLEKFQISRFLAFLRLTLVTSSWVEASVASLLRMLRNSLYELLTSGPSSRKKYLDKLFKIFLTRFWRLDLATCSQLIPVPKNACFA